MEVEVGTSHPKESRTWEPGKCIPQASKAPRYVINSTRVGEHTQFMKEHALIGNFFRVMALGRRPHALDQNMVEP
jgi:hypothetical protein